MRIKKPAPRDRDYATAVGDAVAKLVNAIGRSGSSQADIARALGVSPAFVSRKLNGTRNMTLRTLSDLAWAVDHRLRIQLEPKRVAHNHPAAPPTNLPIEESPYPPVARIWSQEGNAAPIIETRKAVTFQ
jgi:transcriptional regulator with XRE-family HTH domain